MAQAVSRPLIFVREPAATLADGIVTHIEASPIDLERARQQWTDYVDAWRSLGWSVAPVAARDDLPDSVFIEDAVVVFGGVAVITRPGADARKPETEAAEDAAAEQGLAVVHITWPGTLDGGDVLKVGSTVYVGHGGRTNTEGIRQLAEIVGPLGYAVVAVPTTKALHLKSAVTALPDGTIIGYEPIVDHPEMFPNFLAVPEEQGAHVVRVDDSTVVMSSRAPKTAELFRARGLTVVAVDIEEFEKLEGCVTCLSVRVR